MGAQGCDDGNTAAGDGCNITCGVEPFVAKPGVVTSLEQVNALREAEGI